ncbi:MAG: glycine zipper 2TM domain-containing protein, partial [Pseudomonadota bacterium]
MRNQIVIALVAIGLGMSGCAQSGYGTKQTIGGLTGAALGGLLGAQFGSGTGRLATTGAGVLIGALIGSEIGQSLDETDRLRANDAISRSYDAPIGDTITWNNPNSGNFGAVTPTREGTSSSGSYCREYQQTITVGGESAQGY